jgi:hypothetical protein
MSHQIQEQVYKDILHVEDSHHDAQYVLTLSFFTLQYWYIIDYSDCYLLML